MEFEITSVDRKSFEEFGKRIGYVSSIEDWAKKHRLNVYVAVYEHKEIKEGIVSEIKRRKASLVLDVGCGYGFLISRLNKACPNAGVTGIDIARFQVENAKLRGVSGGLAVSCAEHLPFKSGIFDFVVCSEVIEHVVNPDESLLEMVRMLKENGYLCISTDNPLSIYRRIAKLIFGKIRRKKTVKEDYISLATLADLIPKTIKVYKVVNICPYPLLPMLGPLGLKMVGKAWVSLAEVIEKIPYVGNYFCNKYIVFGIKTTDSCNQMQNSRARRAPVDVDLTN